MASSEIPATSEVLLKTDASKQFLDALLGQGWDQWGQGLGGEEGAELMLQRLQAGGAGDHLRPVPLGHGARRGRNRA